MGLSKNDDYKFLDWTQQADDVPESSVLMLCKGRVQRAMYGGENERQSRWQLPWTHSNPRHRGFAVNDDHHLVILVLSLF